MYVYVTRGHFACACVNPLNDNSVVASNLMAGNRKLARKVTVLLKAISLVLWIPYFPTKNVLHDKNRTFSTRVFTCRFFSSRFPWPFKDFEDPTPKSHVPVQVWFSLAKQCVSMVWFPNWGFYLSGRKCIVAMFSLRIESSVLAISTIHRKCLCGTSTAHIDACAYKMPSCLSMQGYGGLCMAM